MEFEFWWLLALPLFFGMGWIAARVDIKSLLSESRAMPSSYFRGLNFLLNEQPDKAIESFLQVAKENPQTVELQFALGSLFRRRGEVDRAIRMHQDLVNREDLPAEERRQASFELSQDYFKAGLLDHAEQVLVAHGRLGSVARSAPPPPRHLHPGEGLGKGDRCGQEARGERQAQLPEGDRELLLRFDDTDFEVDVFSSDSDFDDRTVQLEAASDFELEECEVTSSSDVFAVDEDEDDVDQNAATALGPAALEEEEEDDGFEEVTSGEIAGASWDVESEMLSTAGRGAVAGPVLASSAASAEWGGLWVGLLGVATVFLLFLAFVSMDLVRNLYDYQGDTPASGIVKSLAGLLFG